MPVPAWLAADDAIDPLGHFSGTSTFSLVATDRSICLANPNFNYRWQLM
jgi:hypothetical protein